MLKMTALAAMRVMGAASAEAASFNCAKASHPLEKLICSNPSLSKLDEDVSNAYKAKLALLFDKAAFKGQQKDWMAIIRKRCDVACLAQDVERDYRQQLVDLQTYDEENYTANYKTADEAQLTITRHTAKQFAFSLSRYSLDDSSKVYCSMPAKKAEEPFSNKDMPVATIDKERHAHWQGKDGCGVDFTFDYDAKSGEVNVQTVTKGCEKYCTGGFTLDDRFMSANNWVAGNQ
ncbi:hypothetical protein GC177_09795 [bacterium]|nr:hypothetical protein [bacterium]